MAPVALEADAVRARYGGADAVVAELALADLDQDRDCSVLIERVTLLDCDARKHAKRQKPVARIVHFLRRVGLARLEPCYIGGEARVHRLGAGDRRLAEAGDGPGGDVERHVERRGRVVGDDFAAGDGGKRPAVFLEPPDDFDLGFQDSARTGVAARDQAEFGGRKAGGVALQRDIAEREDSARIDGDGHRHGTGAVELGVRRQVVERLSLDRDLHHAVIAGLGIEGRDQPLAVGAGFRKQAERPRDRPLRVLHQQRGLLQSFLDVLVVALHR